MSNLREPNERHLVEKWKILKKDVHENICGFGSRGSELFKSIAKIVIGIHKRKCCSGGLMDGINIEVPQLIVTQAYKLVHVEGRVLAKGVKKDNQLLPELFGLPLSHYQKIRSMNKYFLQIYYLSVDDEMKIQTFPKAAHTSFQSSCIRYISITILKMNNIKIILMQKTKTKIKQSTPRDSTPHN